MKKIFLLILIMVALTGCGEKNLKGSDVTVLKLAHAHNEDHPVHRALIKFSKDLEEKTKGSIKVQIYPNSQLGSEREVIELTQSGAIDIVKIGGGSLESFAEAYSIFSLPYLFDNKEHFFRVMDSNIAKELYQVTKKVGFIGLTYYDAGARSVYTSNKPIMHPNDLKGLKIRVQSSATQIKMLELLKGSPTPIAYGEVYAALQQGVIDGAENSELNLISTNHSEVAKEFTYTEHTIVPDILIISLNTWEKLNQEQKEAISEAAKQSTEFQKKIWAKETEEAIEQARKDGVHFNKPDLTSFRKAVQPLHIEFQKKESTRKYYKKIREVAEK
ncbi:TRAP transporter substrate-binding protein DctP [Priestia flexa]|uniref:TRAP transporter substrate-binding protein DctP n=1 Tax=Priestia flexa TaxID=86664 RepID=UPI001B32D8D4|nr:TRAP transporter substrate-binding protein DctP [Priestia flexa]